MHVPWYEDYFTADYWSYADAEYSTERTSAEVSYLAQVLDQHAPGRRVLDLGCGVGRHSIGLARLGFELTGIDVSRYALDRAAGSRTRPGCGSTGSRVTCSPTAAGRTWSRTRGDLRSLLGWGSDTDQLRLLRSLRRLLPPDGLLVLDHSSMLGIARIYAAHARAEIGATSFTFDRHYDPVSARSAGQVLVERPDGTRAVLPDDIRMYTPAEIRSAAGRAYFDVIRADADFSCDAPVTVIPGTFSSLPWR